MYKKRLYPIMVHMRPYMKANNPEIVKSSVMHHFGVAKDTLMD